MIRLREGVPVEFARERITAAARAVGSDFRPDWAGVKLESVRDRYVAEMRPLLLGINAATALVFALVCANVAILMLLRALRTQDMYLAGSFLMLMAALTVIGVFLSDLALAALDPRIRQGAERSR